MPHTPSSRDEFRAGIQALAPGLFGTGAWGLVTGVAIVKSGLSLPLAVGMTIFVYAGSAQLAVLPLLAAGAPLWVILLTAAVVNLRFVIYSAGIAPYFQHFPLLKRLALGYLGTDLGMAVFMARYQHGADQSHITAFYLGGALANWLAWQSCSLMGVFLAAQIPMSWSLDFAGTLALIALAIPLTSTRPAMLGAAIAGIVAVLCHSWPLKLGLVAAVICGLIGAIASENYFSRNAHAQ